MKFNQISKSLFFILAGLFTVSPTFGQTAGGAQNETAFMFYMVVGLVFFVSVLVLITAIYTLQVLRVIISKEIQEDTETAQPTVSMWDQLVARFTRAVPIAQESNILTDHDYDGIKELDNHLPPWWLGLFYFTIIFGVVYLLSYHVFDLFPSQAEEYAIELEQAEEAKALFAQNQPAEAIDETTLEYTDDAVILASGNQIFQQQCATCHGPDGGGIAGPNLTDEYWIHGGGVKNVFYTINVGVQGTAMIPWGQKLPPAQIRDVTMYVLSLEGTTPANPKAPEGEVWVPEEKPAEAAPDSVQAEVEEVAEEVAMTE